MDASMGGVNRSLTLYRIARSGERAGRRGSDLCVLRDKVSGWKRSDLNDGMCVAPMSQVRRPESCDLIDFQTFRREFVVSFDYLSGRVGLARGNSDR
jgi:hypothetical protein